MKGEREQYAEGCGVPSDHTTCDVVSLAGEMLTAWNAGRITRVQDRGRASLVAQLRHQTKGTTARTIRQGTELCDRRDPATAVTCSRAALGIPRYRPRAHQGKVAKRHLHSPRALAPEEDRVLILCTFPG